MILVINSTNSLRLLQASFHFGPHCTLLLLIITLSGTKNNQQPNQQWYAVLSVCLFITSLLAMSIYMALWLELLAILIHEHIKSNMCFIFSWFHGLEGHRTSEWIRLLLATQRPSSRRVWSTDKCTYSKPRLHMYVCTYVCILRLVKTTPYLTNDLTYCTLSRIKTCKMQQSGQSQSQWQ